VRARAFFDAWTETTCGVSLARRFPETVAIYRSDVVSRISERHGPKAGEAAGRMFDTLRADIRAMSEKP
jgi:hypothetical protein